MEVAPLKYGIIITSRLTEISNGELDNYLGLDITLVTSELHKESEDISVESMYI